jgi:hypothetical protein
MCRLTGTSARSQGQSDTGLRRHARDNGMIDIQQAAWEMCERVSEAQALLNDYSEGGRFTASELVQKLKAIFEEQGLLRAMHEVGFFEIPPPVLLADH